MPRQVGDWTQDKLKFFTLYLRSYLQATTRATERVFIDAFAGPGTNLVRSSKTTIDGSPLIALNAKAQNGTTFSRLFFIESDPALASELEEAKARRGHANRGEVVIGDVNSELPRVLASVSKRSPTLVFLDTEDIEPRWSTLEAIASWRVDLFINFPLGMGIKRNLQSQKVTAYFGTEDWQDQLSSDPTDREFLNLYRDRLKALGFDYLSEDDRLIKTRANRPLYYLLLASKHSAARKIIDWVFKQPDATGQARLL